MTRSNELQCANSTRHNLIDYSRALGRSVPSLLATTASELRTLHEREDD